MRFFLAGPLWLFTGSACGMHIYSFVNLVSRQENSSDMNTPIQPNVPDDTMSFLPVNPEAMNMSAAQCNVTCASYSVKEAACTTPHCGCNVDFLSAQGYCGLCQTEDPKEAATVQLLLDAEIMECRSEDIHIDFRLQLSNDAQQIINEVHYHSAALRRWQKAFLGLQIGGGHVGLPLVLILAVLSGNVDPTFLNFCITGMFSSVAFSLVLYRGIPKDTIINPLGMVPPDICLVQAVLIGSAQVMTACATLALVTRLWLGLRQALSGRSQGKRQNVMITAGLCLAPYVAFLCISIAGVFVGKQFFIVDGISLQAATPTNFYCMVVQNSFFHTTYGATLALLIITILLDIHIIVTLWKNWLALRGVRHKNSVSRALLLRMIVFSVYRIAVVVAYGIVVRWKTVTEPKTTPTLDFGDSIALSFSIPVWIDMLQALIPVVATLVFGSNSALFAAPLSWLPENYKMTLK